MSEEPNHSFLDELGADLAKTLGEAIWAFAKIEWLTYEYIEAFGGDDLLSLVGEQSFSNRIQILRKLVERRTEAEDQKGEVLRSLKAAGELSKKRNIIVHNPWQVYVDLEVRELVTKIYKRINPEYRFDVEEVKKFAAQSEETFRALEAGLSRLLIKRIL